TRAPARRTAGRCRGCTSRCWRKVRRTKRPSSSSGSKKRGPVRMSPWSPRDSRVDVSSQESSLRIVAFRLVAALLPVVFVGSLYLANRWSYEVPRGVITQLTHGRSFEGLPSLSPDGGWIAYRSDASGNGDIILTRVDGQETFNLTASSADDESDPAFSPDGRQVAFRSARGGIS